MSLVPAGARLREATLHWRRSVSESLSARLPARPSRATQWLRQTALERQTEKEHLACRTGATCRQTGRASVRTMPPPPGPGLLDPRVDPRVTKMFRSARASGRASMLQVIGPNGMTTALSMDRGAPVNRDSVVLDYISSLPPPEPELEPEPELQVRVLIVPLCHNCESARLCRSVARAVSPLTFRLTLSPTPSLGLTLSHPLHRSCTTQIAGPTRWAATSARNRRSSHPP